MWLVDVDSLHGEIDTLAEFVEITKTYFDKMMKRSNYNGLILKEQTLPHPTIFVFFIISKQKSTIANSLGSFVWQNRPK